MASSCIPTPPCAEKQDWRLWYRPKERRIPGTGTAIVSPVPPGASMRTVYAEIDFAAALHGIAVEPCGMKKKAIFTTSWDDGHPLDTRIAELLSRHGFQGTFYMPLSNREGLPVMPPGEMRRLGQEFEIGSPPPAPRFLQTVDAAEGRRGGVGGGNP